MIGSMYRNRRRSLKCGGKKHTMKMNPSTKIILALMTLLLFCLVVCIPRVALPSADAAAASSQSTPLWNDVRRMSLGGQPRRPGPLGGSNSHGPLDSSWGGGARSRRGGDEWSSSHSPPFVPSVSRGGSSSDPPPDVAKEDAPMGPGTTPPGSDSGGGSAVATAPSDTASVGVGGEGAGGTVATAPPVAAAATATSVSASPIPPSTTKSSIGRVGGAFSAISSRLKDITERTGAAVVIIALMYLLVDIFRTDGIVALCFASQLAMYRETCGTIEEYSARAHGIRPLKRQTYQKYWWFLTVSMATSIRSLVVCAHKRGDTRGLFCRVDETTVDLVAYAMAALGLVKAVMGMSLHEAAGPEAFRTHLAKMAAYHFALLFVVAQSSFWILTVNEFGVAWIIYPSLLVIVNDTMAYVFGCLLGRNKLLPRLSPKKTVEGFLGAGLSTLAVSVPLLKVITSRSACCKDLTRGAITEHALVLSTFVSLVAPFGGFLASAVKRAFGTKDFGKLIPGHGGVMDRFDCHVVTAPFVYLYLRQFLGRNLFDLASASSGTAAAAGASI